MSRRLSWPLMVLVLLLPTVAGAQQLFPMEVYQDFRGKAPMLAEFRLEDPNPGSVTTPEAAGLRMTLPKTRKVHQPVQIAANFVITGDFEITGTYELLAADMPTDGYGVGVSLNIATTNDLKTFLKISRVMRPDKGSVFMAEYWTKGADDWTGPQQRTAVRNGQLRLARAGTTARCQVSDGPGMPFTTIFEKDDFTTDDIVYLRFQVTDGNKPGYGVDARIADLRIRYGRPAPKAAAPGQAKNIAPRGEDQSNSSDWPALTLMFGLGMTLAAACAVGLLLFVRRKQGSQESRTPAKIVAFACGACGTPLKARADTGKKLKCPKCQAPVVVPGQDPRRTPAE